MASNLAFVHLTESLPLLGSLTLTVLPGGKPHTCRKGLREAGWLTKGHTAGTGSKPLSIPFTLANPEPTTPSERFAHGLWGEMPHPVLTPCRVCVSQAPVSPAGFHSGFPQEGGPAAIWGNNRSLRPPLPDPSEMMTVSFGTA